MSKEGRLYKSKVPKDIRELYEVTQGIKFLDEDLFWRGELESIVNWHMSEHKIAIILTDQIKGGDVMLNTDGRMTILYCMPDPLQCKNTLDVILNIYSFIKYVVDVSWVFVPKNTTAYNQKEKMAIFGTLLIMHSIDPTIDMDTYSKSEIFHEVDKYVLKEIKSLPTLEVQDGIDPFQVSMIMK